MEVLIDKKTRSSDDIDVYIGSQLKKVRSMMGYSQSKLAGKIGVTFQQLQKYESGKNRVSAGRLFQISQITGVEIEFFFRGANLLTTEEHDLEDYKDLQKITKSYLSIENKELRTKLLSFMKDLAK